MEKIKKEKGGLTVKNRRKNSGITLVALVVTIVVLLILAGITINLLFSDNGIINKAQNAADKTNEALQEEQQGINDLASPLNNVIGGTGTTPEKPLVADGSFNATKGVNTPKLGSGMIPVKYSGTEWVVTTTEDKDWYKYTTTEKQWANIMLTDGLKVEGITDATTASLAEMKDKKVTSLGSMYVWIPRYAYQIASEYHTNSSTGGIINIKFLQGTSNTASDGTSSWNNSSGLNNWNIHPAFDYGEPTSGIWVAKFEASHTGCTTTESTGQYDGTAKTLQVKPGVTSWRAITVSNIYTVCLNYNTTLNSHMMKNSEWGACAYLAQSSYGKNSEVWINPNSNFITGQAGTSASAGATTSTYAYDNTTYGVQASTTGNVYGIYDMSGGAFEYTAAYVNNSYATSNGTGNSLVSGATKTKDVYNVGSSDDGANNYAANSSKYGDAIYETSNNCKTTDGSWEGDYSYFPKYNNPFFLRGGAFSHTTGAGTFNFTYELGYDNSSCGFRPVLIVL